jgi:hypothetical protein
MDDVNPFDQDAPTHDQDVNPESDPDELTDEDLENVAGGVENGNPPQPW